MTPATEAADALAHRGRLMAARVERVVDLEWGSALWHRSLPRVHDLNIVRLEAATPDLTAAELTATVERLQEDLPYRRFEIWDESTAERLLPALEAAGFETDWILLMAYRGETPEVAAEVEAATSADLEHLEAEWLKSDLPRWEPRLDELVEQILASHALTYAAVSFRGFCIRIDGKPVTMASLLDEGRTVIVEDVYTTPPHRGQGLAAKVVRGAVAAAREGGAECVYLPTDANGLARLFYKRLGFSELSVVTRFLKRGS